MTLLVILSFGFINYNSNLVFSSNINKNFVTEIINKGNIQLLDKSITEEQLDDVNQSELRLIRNTIYA